MVCPPLHQRESFNRSVRLIISVARVDVTATWRNREEDRAMRHLVSAFLLNLKKIVFKSFIYTLQHDELLNYPPIPDLLLVFVTALPFIFSEFDNVAVETLNIVKQMPPTLEVINVEDAAPSCVEHVTTIATL